jgi:hypothetical protein
MSRNAAILATVLLAMGMLSAPVCAKSSHSGTSTARASAAQGRSLWIAQFTGQTKALAAIASVQQGDLATLQQSSLFGKVSSYAAEANQPAGTWVLSAKETSFSKGSAAKRTMLIGWGRAHIEMAYKLRNPKGKVVWSKEIKTETFPVGGVIGGLQNQKKAFSKQPQQLLKALSKFFASE